MSRGDLKAVGWIVVVVCVATVVGAYFLLAPGPAAARAHGEALDRWTAREPSSYSFTYSYCSGMCVSCPVRVTVRDGEVVEAVSTEPESRCGPRHLDSAFTIEDFFALAEEHRPGMFGDVVSISYDPVWGFPSYIDITCRDRSSDCGSGWDVGDFVDLTAG